MARVLWRDAQGKEGVINLTGGEVLIGRGLNCAIRTEDARVSRHHARIFCDNGEYIVEDLGSVNKVFYQEEEVRRHVMRHGDAIRCGSLWLRYVDEEKISQATPTPADADETALLRRRIEQMKTEIYHIMKEPDRAREHIELLAKNAKIEDDLVRVQQHNSELKEQIQKETADARTKQANEVREHAITTCELLRDQLSDINSNAIASADIFEQYENEIAKILPTAFFEELRNCIINVPEAIQKCRQTVRELDKLAN